MLFPILQQVRQNLSNHKKPLFCAVTACAFFDATLPYRLIIPDGGYINMANAVYGNYILFLLCACIGIVFLMMFCLSLDSWLPQRQTAPARFMSFLGRNTLCVFVTHKPIIHMFGKLFSIVRVPNAVSLVVTCVGAIAASCLIALFLNRYLPTAVGRFPDRNPVGLHQT